MMKTKILTFTALALCTSISFAQKPNYIKADILDTSDEVANFLSLDELPFSVCIQDMKETFNFLRYANKDFFKSDYTPLQNKTILENLWRIKKGIRKHAKAWTLSNEMNSECVSQIKASLKATRYIEDNIGLLYHNQTNQDKVTGLKEEDHTPLFSKSLPWTVSDSTFDHTTDLQSGDLLMWRGNSAVSASIARLGDNENNFSHLSILYVHPETGKRYNIEALIEVGLIARDFDKVVVKKGASKVVVYRHSDQVLAQEAAKFAYEQASKRTANNFIPYDFSFDLEEHSSLFCSELISWVFDEASNGTVKVPMFNTKIELRNRSYVDAIGLLDNTAFQPGDIELEPNLTMIAEWRNLHQVRTNQLMDNILSNMYSWMETYNYHFRWNLYGDALGTALYLFRKVPYLGEEVIGGKIPANMPVKTLKNILTLDKTSAAIYKKMFADLYTEDKTKIYSFKEIDDKIEELREIDLKNFKAGIRTFRRTNRPEVIFHDLFKPKK